MEVLVEDVLLRLVNDAAHNGWIDTYAISTLALDRFIQFLLIYQVTLSVYSLTSQSLSKSQVKNPNSANHFSIG